MAILWSSLAVPLCAQGTRFFRMRSRDPEGPPLREGRHFGCGAGQWEARTAAQRGEAAECKHSRGHCEPHVSLRATRRVWDHRGQPQRPSAAKLRNAFLALCSSLPKEVSSNPLLQLPAPPTRLPPGGWVCPHCAPLRLPGGFPLLSPRAQETFALSFTLPSCPPDLQFRGFPRVKCLSRAGPGAGIHPTALWGQTGRSAPPRARPGPARPRPAAASAPCGARASCPRGREPPASVL